MGTELAALEDQMRPLLPQLQQALADRMPAERLLRTVMVSVERQPKLLTCSRQSVFSSAMTAAFLGLEVDGVTGQAYLVPFKDKRLGMISQLLIGYQGFNTLGARSGYTITADVVREGDEFDFAYGSAPFIRHKPQPDTGRRIIWAWSCATSRSLPPIPCVLPIGDIMAIKERSKAAGSEGGFSPWDDPKIGFPAMAAKTARRRLRRSMPLNAMTRDYHLAARLDEAYEEQGQPSAIRPDGMLMVGGAASPLPERQQSETPTLTDLETPRDRPEIVEAKADLADAASAGTDKLRLAWHALGRTSPRLTKELVGYLESTLKPMAAEADKEGEVI